MANWDFISPYDDQAATWLADHGYERPDIRPGNRMPSTADIKWAVGRDRVSPEEYPLVIDNFDWDNDATMDASAVAESHNRAGKHDDGWSEFHREMYGGKHSTRARR